LRNGLLEIIPLYWSSECCSELFIVKALTVQLFSQIVHSWTSLSADFLAHQPLVVLARNSLCHLARFIPI